MPHLIDTNVAILMRDGDPPTLQRLEAFPRPALLSTISRVELENGVYRNAEEAELLRLRLDRILSVLIELPFRTQEAEAYGRIVEQCGYSRRKVIDRMVAATAIVAGAVLATLNPRDFRDIPGLTIEDWSG